MGAEPETDPEECAQVIRTQVETEEPSFMAVQSGKRPVSLRGFQGEESGGLFRTLEGLGLCHNHSQWSRVRSSACFSLLVSLTAF